MKLFAAFWSFAVLTAIMPVFASAPALADGAENRDIALRALSEVFDGRDDGAIDALYHPDYVGHAPAVAAGRAGLREFVIGMRDKGAPARREIARVLVQGNLAGVHSRVGAGENAVIAGDMFRFRDGKIIEHWATVQKETPKSETASGNSMIDGGGDADIEISNMDLARNTTNAVEFFARGIAGDTAVLERLFGGEYIQHNPGFPDGGEAIIEFFKGGDGTLGNVIVHQTISDGDMTMALVEYADWGNAVVEIVRHDKNGRIVEHWDVIQPIPAAEDFAHDNGMF
ncbi:MAG: nuclear transport factor 2 family protein [Gammaproteobacteria bacterium]